VFTESGAIAILLAVVALWLGLKLASVHREYNAKFAELRKQREIDVRQHSIDEQVIAQLEDKNVQLRLEKVACIAENKQLEKRIVELTEGSDQVKHMWEEIRARRGERPISIVNQNTGGDSTVGGDVAGRDTRRETETP